MKRNQQLFVLSLLIVVTATTSLVTAGSARAAISSTQCPGTAAAATILLTDWESGLGPWTVGSYEVFRPETFDTPDWAVVDSLPDNRNGQAAFVANVDLGDCAGDDESGVLTLTSPPIEIPNGVDEPRVSFAHWFDIEYGWDGGNLKISVNGGPFDLIPGSAFEENAYTGTLFDAFDQDGISYNTNPLAEQDAFTGPEDDQATGSWLESHINLLGIASPGDSIQLRFDFGVDACYGKTGWYVDDVEVYSCGEEQPTDATLTLVKEVINDNGGSVTDPNDFGLRIDGFLVSHNTSYVVTAGDHIVSEDGLPGYRGGDWGGDCAPDGSITLQPGQAAVCTITNDDIDTDFQINAGHSGAWYDQGTSGQGVLIDIGPPGQDMFVAWFTYTDAESDSPFEHRWLTAQGKYSGGTAQLVLYETLGGRFDDPQPVSYTTIGEITLNFYDCNTAEMIYSFDNEGLEGTIPLTRVIPESDNICTERDGSVLQAVDINAGMDGAWYDPFTSGQGFLVDAHTNAGGGNFIFVAWFTYGDDTASGQRWLTAQGSFEGPTAEIDIIETTGGSFDDPLRPSWSTVGTMRIDFEDCSHAVLSYSLPDDGAENQIPIKRLLAGEEDLCEEIVGLE